MTVIVIIYALLVALTLAGTRRYPSGPFLLANAYTLFLTLPAALLFYANHVVDGAIDYGDYTLDDNIYIAFFCFQAVSLLLSLTLYRWGFRQRERNPIKHFLAVDSESVAYKRTITVFVFISVSTLIYVHSAFGFEFILEPRRLYELSRADFGSQFFLLGLTLRLAALLVLMSTLKHRQLIFVALLVFSLATGAKINTYVMLMFAAAHYVVFRRKARIPILLLLKLLLIAAPLVYVLISITFQGVEINIIELLIAYVNEPWNNFVLLVQSYSAHFPHLFGGLLTWENNVISRMPRLLFPDKPYLFGGFRLANEYFPDAVALGIGAPSFGAEGIVYADWGVTGLAMLMIFNGTCFWLLGRITAILVRAPQARRFGFLYFGLLLVLSDFYFLTLPPSNNLLDNTLIVLALAITFRIRVVSRRRVGTLAVSDLPTSAA